MLQGGLEVPAPRDARVREVCLHFLPVETRVPLKFGPETLTHVTCARVRVLLEAPATAATGAGWGETPLSVQWVWPATISFEDRHQALKVFCERLARTWARFDHCGHPLEIGYAFQRLCLPGLLEQFNRERSHPMPWLAALVCCSAFDLAVHDAYGILHQCPVYDTYNSAYMNQDLSAYLQPADGCLDVSFDGRYPADYFDLPRAETLPAWHLVGGLDPLSAEDLTGEEPADGHPVLLADWIERDGLTCLKIKLRGDDTVWDYQRLQRVGAIAIEHGVSWLTADFNCTVTEPGYVNDILDQLVQKEPRLYGMILYVEQPFPYDLEQHRIDVHSVAARKPLYMDESAHDWELIRLGRSLGWTGVALKTCKTQTGALLSLCWAKAHGMGLMVQDLTNPMLAQIPHVQLAAHAGTIMGVETNSMQFYPEASAAEAAVHPGVYQRRDGRVDLTSVKGPGFGYGLSNIQRDLPAAVVSEVG